MGSAYRIVTPRLVIRCWAPGDAPLLKEAIDSSVDHLRPWLPWAAQEPETLEKKLQRIRRWRGEFDLGAEFVYGVFDRSESRVQGGGGLHRRVGPEAFEIGYWIRFDAIGQGLATELAGALTRVAIEIEKVARVEIHMVATNGRSAAVPRKLGYVHEATVRRPPPDGGELQETMIWTIFADRYAESAAARTSLEAYGFGGDRLL